MCTPETNFCPVLTGGCTTRVLLLYNPSHLFSYLRGALASYGPTSRGEHPDPTRYPNGLRLSQNPPATSYARGTPTSESPSGSIPPSASEISESSCPIPPLPPTPHSSHLPTFAPPPLVVQSKGSCATVKTASGGEVNADLTARFWPLFTNPRPLHPSQLLCAG